MNTGCSSIEANPDEVEIDTNDVDVPKELAITEDAKHNLQFLRFVQNNWSEHAYSTGMLYASLYRYDYIMLTHYKCYIMLACALPSTCMQLRDCPPLTPFN